MAVYTSLERGEVEVLLQGYDLGAYVAHEGITEGVENSNFLLLTERGRHILTVYERRVDPADLPFFLGLMHHLVGWGVPCPLPIENRAGSALTAVRGKPAAIFGFLEGRWPRRITPERCRALGQTLADLHAAGRGFDLSRANALAIDAWAPLFAQCLQSARPVPDGLRREVEAALGYLTASWPRGLQAGVIHADLFPDNVFFERDIVTGVIDFYFACNDLLAYDLAICLNAWVFEPNSEFNLTKARALIEGYAGRRALPQAERDALPILCRGAALRFLLTRLYDELNQVEGANVKVKDPSEYLRKLRFFATNAEPGLLGLD